MSDLTTNLGESGRRGVARRISPWRVFPPRRARFRTIAVLGALLLLLAAGGCQDEPATSITIDTSNCLDTSLFDGTVTAAAPGTTFVRVSGTNLVVGEEPANVYLRGINVDLNQLWNTARTLRWVEGFDVSYPQPDTAVPPALVVEEVSEAHFREMAEVGFNTIRVRMTYRLFEDNSSACAYKQQGWTLIDQLVEWAETHGLYLILAMATPPGGSQPSNGGGAALWSDTGNQTRLINLWRAMARRYADETTIAAFDLLDRPTPTPSCATAQYFTANCASPYGAESWSALAQRLVSAVRSVDTNHVLIVQMADWVYDAAGGSPLLELSPDVVDAFQFTITDTNTVYGFPFFYPASFVFAFDACLEAGDCTGKLASPATYPSADTVTFIDGTEAAFDSSYLSTFLGDFANFGVSNGVPMMVQSWGGHIIGFSAEGGRTYAADMMCAMDTRGMHWGYLELEDLYTDSQNSLLDAEVSAVFSTYFTSPATACGS